MNLNSQSVRKLEQLSWKKYESRATCVVQAKNFVVLFFIYETTMHVCVTLHLNVSVNKNKQNDVTDFIGKEIALGMNVTWYLFIFLNLIAQFTQSTNSLLYIMTSY